MAGKTQSELEQAAKVYQLQMLDAKLETIGFQLKKIVEQTASSVSVAQLDAAKKDWNDDLAEAVKDIHNEYRPMLKRNRTLWATIMTLFFMIVGQAILIVNLRP